MSGRTGFPLAWFVDAIPAGMECPICMDVVREPQNLEVCAHLFCKACLAKHGHPECPTCRAKLPQRSVLAALPFVDLLVANLRVRCDNYAAGCQWVHALGPQARNREEHISACPFALVTCEDCDESIMRSALQDHYSTACSKRAVVCEHCSDEFALDELADHLASPPCRSFTLCANQCAQRVVRIDHAARHHYLECACTGIRCFLCTSTIPRSELAEHMQTHMREATCEDAQALAEHCAKTPAGPVLTAGYPSHEMCTMASISVLHDVALEPDIDSAQLLGMLARAITNSSTMSDDIVSTVLRHRLPEFAMELIMAQSESTSTASEATFVPLIQLLNQLLEYAGERDETLRLQQRMRSPEFFRALILHVSEVKPDPVSALALRLTRSNAEATAALCAAILRRIEEDDFFDFYTSLKVMQRLLARPCSDDALYAVDHLLPQFVTILSNNRVYYKATQVCIKVLIWLSRKSDAVRAWLCEHAINLDWIDPWLQANPTMPAPGAISDSRVGAKCTLVVKDGKNEGVSDKWETSWDGQ